MSCQHYLGKARIFLLRVLLRKVPTMLVRELQQVADEAWASLHSQKISDSNLQRALAPGISIKEQLPTLLRSAARVQFFVNPAEKEEGIALLRQIAPEAPELVVSEADRICKLIFDLLRSGQTPLVEKTD